MNSEVLIQLWHLSFAGNEGWRGGYLCEAEGDMLAHLQCTLNGCNPGGECLFLGPIMVDEEAEKKLRPFMNRLLTKGDLVDMDRTMGGKGGLVRVDDVNELGNARVEYPS